MLAHGERLRPLPAGLRAARPRRPPGRDRAAERARDLEPDKASIREALGRALFHARRYASAAPRVPGVASSAPTNDYALFCLGRSMQLLGRHREACQPLALACSLRPSARTTGCYRDRARRDAGAPDADAAPRRADADAILDGQLSCRRAGAAAVPRVGARPLFLRQGVSFR